MFGASLTINTLPQAMTTLAGNFPNAIVAVARNTRDELYPLLEQLTGAPGPVARPVRFQTDRQRRAFFASKGFGKGIPYKRTGATANSFTMGVQRTPSGALFTLITNSKVAPFLYGTFARGNRWQQIMHFNTGWTPAPIIDDEITRGMERGIKEKFARNARRYLTFK